MLVQPKEYYVGVTMLNCFTVEATSEAEAIAIVESYDAATCLDGVDFNVNYVDELTVGE